MRVLIVEDELAIIDFLKKCFEAECFVVDLAYDGEQGSFLARTNDYDLVILDNIMPKKTGLEVCRDIRRDGRTVPIIVLSVRSEASEKVDLLNAGADDYLTKPFSLDELMARVRALLRRPRQIESDVYQIDDLVLDTSRYSVRRGAEEIRLTKKEFSLLKYLMKNQGVVLSRGMIMEHVWETSADPFSNTIECHILSLRKKIDGEGKSKLIQTISGRGYKIDPP
jgi:DNA-binding response OmpR family regulator